MAKRCTTAKRAVMAGGGLLNLKATFALRERGVDVTLVVSSPAILSQLMERMTPHCCARPSSRRVKIVAGASVKGVLSGKGGVTGVAPDGARNCPATWSAIGKGVEPIVDYLAGSGIALERGIVVDRHCETSAPGVYAAGDVGVTHNPITGEPVVTGLWTNAAEMGRCAGRNMAGRARATAGPSASSTRRRSAPSPSCRWDRAHRRGRLRDPRRVGAGLYRKVVFSRTARGWSGRSSSGASSARGSTANIIRENRPIAKIKDKLLSQTLHYGDLLPAPARRLILLVEGRLLRLFARKNVSIRSSRRSSGCRCG